MELRQLKHFVAVADEQSFTRAARRVHIVQSALSTSIQMLEAELGTQLFMRSTRQVRLTAAGRLFYDKVQTALHAISDAHNTLTDIHGLHRGTLTIGSMPSLPAFLGLPGLLEEFHGQYPHIEIRLSQEDPAHLLEKVKDGRLDLAFVPVCEPPSGVATIMIACEALVIACKPTHPLAGRKDVTLAELANEPFVDFEPDWGTRELVDRLFLPAGIDRRIAFEISDLDTLLALVARGLGIALVPEVIAETQGPSLGIASLAGPELCWEVVVAYAAGKQEGSNAESRASQAFLTLLTPVDISEAA